MVQGLQARVPVEAEVWVEAPEAAEAEWAGHLRQGRAVIAYVRTAGQRLFMLQDSLVMQ
ncbi:MAG: hypothetical protein HQ580_04880 [Planctomycetes bacterium]|nr:hypothetical protein [Planctomycetota bacterium]